MAWEAPKALQHSPNLKTGTSVEYALQDSTELHVFYRMLHT